MADNNVELPQIFQQILDGVPGSVETDPILEEDLGTYEEEEEETEISELEEPVASTSPVPSPLPSPDTEEAKALAHEDALFALVEDSIEAEKLNKTQENITERTYTERTLRALEIFTESTTQAASKAAAFGITQDLEEDLQGERAIPETFLEEVINVGGNLTGQVGAAVVQAKAGAGIGALAGSPGGPVGMAAGASIGSAIGFSSAIFTSLYNNYFDTKESDKARAIAGGASEEEAEAAATTSARIGTGLEALSFIPVIGLLSKSGRFSKLSKVLPDSVTNKISKKIYDLEVATKLDVLATRAPRIRRAVIGGTAEGLTEAATESTQGGVSDYYVAIATGETSEKAFGKALDPEKRFNEFATTLVGAGIFGGGLGAITTPSEQAQPGTPTQLEMFEPTVELSPTQEKILDVQTLAMQVSQSTDQDIRVPVPEGVDTFVLQEELANDPYVEVETDGSGNAILKKRTTEIEEAGVGSVAEVDKIIANKADAIIRRAERISGQKIMPTQEKTVTMVPRPEGQTEFQIIPDSPVNILQEAAAEAQTDTQTSQLHTTVVTEPTQSNIEVPIAQPVQLSMFQEPDNLQAQPQPVQATTVTQQANSREGIYAAPEIPGADNPNHGTGRVDTVIQNDTLMSSPYTGSYDAIAIPPETGGGFLGGLNFVPAPDTQGANDTQIIDSFDEILSVTGTTFIREASLERGGGAPRGLRKTVLGFFAPWPQIIRTKVANAIPVAAHEAGHALEVDLFGLKNPWMTPMASSNMKTELYALGKALYKDQIPNGGYMREGWAEFFRIYTTRPGDRAKLSETAPELYTWFESEILSKNPKLKSAIDKTATLSDSYQKQTAKQRAANKISTLEAVNIRRKQALRRFHKLIKGATPYLEKIFIEDGGILRSIEQAAADGVKQENKTLEERDKIFKNYRALRGTVASRVKYMIEEGGLDFSGIRNDNPSLKQATNLVKGRETDAAIYLWALRTVTLAAGKNSLTPREQIESLQAQRKEGATFRTSGVKRLSGLNLQDALEIIESVEGEADGHKFQLMADQIYKVQDGVLNYVAQAAPNTMAPVVQRIREFDPGFYIPLQRVFRELDTIYKSNAQNIQTGSVFKQLSGSGRNIQNPFDAIMTNMTAQVDAAHRRSMFETLYRLSQLHGMGHLIVRVNTNIEPTIKNMGDALDSILKNVPQEEAGQVRDIIEEAVPDLYNEMVTFFAPSKKSPTGPYNYIPLYRNGKVQWFEVDSDLYDLMQQDSSLYLSGMLANALMYIPARIARAGTTSLRATFTLITNPTRDIQAFRVLTQTNASIPTILQTWFKLMADGAYASFTGKPFTKDGQALYDFAKRSGLQQAMRLTQNTPMLKSVRRRLLGRTKLQAILDVNSHLELVERFLSFPELATRLTEVKLLAKELNIDLEGQMTAAEVNTLLLAGKEVTTDFTAAGSLGRLINRAVPFFNANIQGPRALVRATSRNPAKVALRMGEMSILAAMNWYLNKDEEWWKELTSDEKYMYSWIQEDDTLLRIPRAFEIQGIAMGATEAMLDSWYNQDPEAVKEWFGSFTKTAIPVNFNNPAIVPLPVLVDEFADQLANKDHFFDRPIVPRSLEREAEENQINEYTSETAKFLGKLFGGVSPMRVDHVIRGVFGGVGSDIVRTIESGHDALAVWADEGKIEFPGYNDPADYPIIGTLFNRGGAVARYPKSIDKLYDISKEYYQARADETKEDRNKRLLLEDATRAITSLGYIANMTKDSKDKKKILEKRISIAKHALEEVERKRANREPFTAAKKVADRRKKLLRE